ncbi:M17 family metallopeptidase [Brevundimonas sp. 2R-24]|uniref:Probable cytosol aminopeptidase n=1 Tax=Peiella sedimenti TaxID=3061083 RepID=A0ABT8SN02_9CAUL|nr:M17 family metallopeptidase [Caulobacteraceae bacterium XZ-24]
MTRTALASAALAALLLAASPGETWAQARGGQGAPQAQAASIQPRTVTFAATLPQPGGVLVLPLGAADQLDARAAGLDPATRAGIERALASARFTYAARQTLSLRGLGDWDRILVVGTGPAASGSALQWSGAVAGRALVDETGPLTVLAEGLAPDAASAFVTGMGIGHYRSDLYRTSREPVLASGGVTVVASEHEAARSAFQGRGESLIRAMTWVRDISNEPANIIYPESFVARARQAFAGVSGVTIEVLDAPTMERLGMGALTAVGRGSARPPRLLVIRYRGEGAPEGGPVVLAGKGITFDSGGITIKPGENMGNMKMDMSGAASVTGAVLALATSRAPVDVVAVSALAENMPDGNAMRPGDVLTAMNGKTIEVISTDAEGRLVLADALTWAERNLNPAAVVDVATLTGSVRTALGDDYAGLFTRHDALADQLTAAGDVTGERLWRLPLDPGYAEDTRSSIADLMASNPGVGGGAGVGAHFIGEFISRDIPWAHLDIANMAYGGANDWKPAGSAGFAVRLLEQFVRDWRPIPRGAGN